MVNELALFVIPSMIDPSRSMFANDIMVHGNYRAPLLAMSPLPENPSRSVVPKLLNSSLNTGILTNL